MREFLLFFLSIFVIFNVVNGIYKKNQEITQVKSSVDEKIIEENTDAQAAADKLANINKNNSLTFLKKTIEKVSKD